MVSETDVLTMIRENPSITIREMTDICMGKNHARSTRNSIKMSIQKKCNSMEKYRIVMHEGEHPKKWKVV